MIRATARYSFRFSTIAILMPIGSLTASSMAESAQVIKQTISSFDELNMQLTQFDNVSKKFGMGLQTTASDLAYENAQQAFNRSEWLACIQYAQSYLSGTQITDSKKWMYAQYMLGRSYDARGQISRASRAYQRYLSTYSTAKEKDSKNLTEVIERLVLILSTSEAKAEGELAQVLSGLSNLKVSDEALYDLKYFSGVGSNKIGQRSLALSWMENDPEIKQSSDNLARSMYFKSLLAMQQAKWQEARENLQRVLAIPDLKQSAKDGAKIALARVFIKLKKLNSAAEIYDSIDPASSQTRDALYEKTFVLIRLNENARAKDSASKFLNQYPEHSDSLPLRRILSWLEFRSGNPEEAKKSIDSTILLLTETKRRVQDHLSAKTKLTNSDLKNILLLTRGIVDPPKELMSAISMFDQTEDLSRRLDDAHASTLGILFAAAKTDLDIIKPELANRREQIYRFFSTYKDLIDTYISSESSRLAGSINAVDAQRLKSSRQQRVNSTSIEEQFKRDSKRYINWLAPTEQIASLARVWTKLANTEVDLRSRGAYVQSKLSEKNLQDIQKLKNTGLDSLSVLRKEQVKNLVDQSALSEFSELALAYIDRADEEVKIISRYEPNDNVLVESLDDEDGQTLRLQSHQAGVQIRALIHGLYLDSTQNISDVLKKVDALTSRHNFLKNTLSGLVEILELKSGAIAPSLVQHFDREFDLRLSRNQKWSGDLDFYSYSVKSKDQDDLKSRKELELQILSDRSADNPGERSQKW